MGGQDEPNLALWLATGAGKMELSCLLWIRALSRKENLSCFGGRSRWLDIDQVLFLRVYGPLWEAQSVTLIYWIMRTPATIRSFSVIKHFLHITAHSLFLNLPFSRSYLSSFRLLLLSFWILWNTFYFAAWHRNSFFFWFLF